MITLSSQYFETKNCKDCDSWGFEPATPVAEPVTLKIPTSLAFLNFFLSLVKLFTFLTLPPNDHLLLGIIREAFKRRGGGHNWEKILFTFYMFLSI